MNNLIGRKVMLRNADPDGVTTGVFLEFSHLEYTPHVPDLQYSGTYYVRNIAETYKSASAIIQLDNASSAIVNIPIADFRFSPMIQDIYQ